VLISLTRCPLVFCSLFIIRNYLTRFAIRRRSLKGSKWLQAYVRRTPNIAQHKGAKRPACWVSDAPHKPYSAPCKGNRLISSFMLRAGRQPGNLYLYAASFRAQVVGASLTQRAANSVRSAVGYVRSPTDIGLQPLWALQADKANHIT
jgi:hypothetical protein